MIFAWRIYNKELV